MAMSWQPYIAQHGQTTSLDLLREQQLPTTSLAGFKRKRDDVENAFPSKIAKCQSTTTFHTASVRPYLKQPNRLQAGRILNVLHNDHNSENADVASEDKTQVSATPGVTQNPLLSLRHPRYALHPTLVDNFESLGVRLIYPWQSACLLGRGVLDGKQNLIYTAPTGGGKSLVADVLMLKRVLDDCTKKAILVLPYVALVQEKLRWLRSLVNGVVKDKPQNTPVCQHRGSRNISESVRVAGFFGGSKDRLDWIDCDIAVCTIEKANAIVNCAIEEGRIDQLGIVVFDELHMLDDEHRGYILELMATKLMCVQNGINVVGMSATLSNPKLLADWLNAKFYVSKYRPVPVQEHIVYDNCIYAIANAKGFFRAATRLSTATVASTQESPRPCRTIEKSNYTEFRNPIVNAVVALAIETAMQGYGALVFKESRHGTENLALLIGDTVSSDHITDETLEKRADVLASLRALPGGFEPSFNKLIMNGVGFHHAGITAEEREIIATAYDSGVLKIMVATCSLAAGINLPARRVIVHGARMGRELIGPAMLRQMRGRAGRKGKDEVGETYLCCSKNELEAVVDIFEADMPPVSSCLTPEKRGVKRALLEVIAINLATSHTGLEEYLHKSLLWQTTDRMEVLQMMENALLDLLSTKLIRQSPSFQDTYEVTQLGSAIVASSLTPEDGIFVHGEMRRALSSFVMDGEMHVFYLFTPIPSSTTPISFSIFRTQLDSLSEADLRAMRLIGVSPSLVNTLALSGLTRLPASSNPPDAEADAHQNRIYQRAYAAFQLRDLCNELPIHQIASKYSVARGQIQTLSQISHGFASGMIKFCSRMGSSFTLLGAVLEHTLDRLRAGARADLLEMAQVTHVKSRMARILWENGFKSVRALAEADPEDLAAVMMLAQAGKLRSKKWQQNQSNAVGDRHNDSRTAVSHEWMKEEEKIREKVRAKAEVVVQSASRIWERAMIAELDE